MSQELVDIEPIDSVVDTDTKGENKRRGLLLILAGLLSLSCLCLTGVFLYATYLDTPQASFTPSTFEVSPGETVSSIANRLEETGIIRSADLLNVIFRFSEDGRLIKAGKYNFDKPLLTREVAKLLTQGTKEEVISITFIEGERSSIYGKKAKGLLSNFDIDVWSQISKEHEGELFPETYFVTPDFSAEELFDLMHKQHKEVVAELIASSSVSASSSAEIVTIASILEREANDLESMRTVAGIFQNRMAIGMPLQADATIEYVIDTPLGELAPGQLAQELRELESPYNSYKNIGLPPTPIGNPGRQALLAALTPIPSDYLFYITGDDGEFYYSETYAGHLIKIERHLR